MEAFGFPRDFIRSIKTLYTGATVLLRVGGGLSRPVEERAERTLHVPTSQPIRVSAYADDITVTVTGQADLETLQEKLLLYERASSASVNWSKCEGYSWTVDTQQKPTLPAGLQWSTEGIKCLGVYLGSEPFRAKNWAGLVEKLYSSATSRFSGDRHSEEAGGLCLGRLPLVKAAVLYLPVDEGGQGLVDISSRLAALRLKTVQRLLYGPQQLWTETATVLLREVGRLNYDKHLFLLDLKRLDLSGISAFYRSVLRAWSTVLDFSREEPYGHAGQEPLFFNSMVKSSLLDSAQLRAAFTSAGLTKLVHLRTERGWKSAAQLSQETGLRSERVLQRLLQEVQRGLPARFREVLGLGRSSTSDRTMELSMVGKKELYVTTVKVLRRADLVDVPESRWSGDDGSLNSLMQCIKQAETERTVLVLVLVLNTRDREDSLVLVLVLNTRDRESPGLVLTPETERTVLVLVLVLNTRDRENSLVLVLNTRDRENSPGPGPGPKHQRQREQSWSWSKHQRHREQSCPGPKHQRRENSPGPGPKPRDRESRPGLVLVLNTRDRENSPGPGPNTETQRTVLVLVLNTETQREQSWSWF
ncbi:hypothetical protein WMY93_033910 [Mugilogobius chulae]|uniref:Reverse transcriptase domain-containing protein n=1 Tax=Mugilogobius chulae TaxID=88201 RepID=A0AAW0MRL1_9GOBI